MFPPRSARRPRPQAAAPSARSGGPRHSSRRRLKLSTGNKLRLGLLAVILVLVVVALTSSALWMRWWWFGSVGYRGVLIDRALHQVATFLVFGAIALALVLGNTTLALRRTKTDRTTGSTVTRFAHRALFYAVAVGSAVAALLIGATAAGRWETFALALNGRSFGLDDPVFGRDIGFFLFAYPAIKAAWTLVFTALLIGAAGTVAVYALRLGLNLRRLGELRGAALRHIAILAGATLAMVGIRLILDNYDLVYSTRGFAVGASYTDLYAVRPANWIGGVALLLLAALCVASRRVPGRRELVVVGASALFLSLGLRVLLPAIVQEAIVSPDEFGKERPYIENAIEMTRLGFGLDGLPVGTISGESGVSQADVVASPTLLENVRLWDYRVARDTYQQLQTFASYYVFLDVDVDRYTLDGQTVQVILSAREMNQDGLPENVRTWTNLRLGYTHGYGVVVSPVDEATRSGLPAYLVENVPPSGSGPLAIAHPEIYFGESDLDWVVVGTGVPEFTALTGVDQTLSIPPDAMHGTIALDDRATRVIAALNLGDRNLMISGNITDDSRLVLHRNIRDRVEMIAPFLTYDADPYLVIADGRLVWVMDAYTTSDRFPHAAAEGGANYIRASVKVTVDAGTGETIFYRTAEVDPVADAYGRIFDDLLVPIDRAPASIASHFRYPELLYERQSQAYASVHVDDPRTFYNGDDRWAIPSASGSAAAVGAETGEPATMPAYYMTLSLPGESTADFSIVRPFVPGGNASRQTMTGWMAGRSDPAGRLSLHVYALPRQTGVLGPAQVEARISQEPTISREITLWSQSGSEVILGNLLVLPIKDTVIYIQPLYLRSTGGSGIPELTRVIVATRDEVVVGETLGAAVAQLTGSTEAVPPAEQPPPGEDPSSAGGTVAEAVDRANEAYERGQAALAAGDWAAYGAAQADLEAALDDLEALAGSGTPTPAATPVP